MKKIGERDDFRPLPEAIRCLESKWATIDAFPKLGHNKSEEILKIE